MKAQILKIAGVKSEQEFYKKYPTEEAFFQAHPEAQMMKKGGSTYSGGVWFQNGGNSFQIGGDPRAQFNGMPQYNRNTFSINNPIVAPQNSVAAPITNGFDWTNNYGQNENTPQIQKTIIGRDGARTTTGNVGPGYDLYALDPADNKDTPLISPDLFKSPSSFTEKLGKFNNGLYGIQDKLAEGMIRSAWVGSVGDAIDGFNNKKDYKKALDKQKQNYSTDYAYNTSYTTAANKGQYDMYNQMMPNQIGGNMSFNGMNQKYNMTKNMAQLGGTYADLSAVSYIPKELDTVRDKPFYDNSARVNNNTDPFVPSDNVNKDDSNQFVKAGKPANYDMSSYIKKALDPSGNSNADISDLPLDADAMLAAIGMQETSSKPGQTSLGKKTAAVGPTGKRGSASGTYQITNDTLKQIYKKNNNINSNFESFDQFKNAFDTNPEVEYAAAKSLMGDHIKRYGIYALGAWYQPALAAKAAKGDMSVMNVVPSKDYGNKITFGKYFNNNLDRYRKAVGRYEEGGEVELTQNEINHILRNGGEIEYI